MCYRIGCTLWMCQSDLLVLVHVFFLFIRSVSFGHCSPSTVVGSHIHITCYVQPINIITIRQGAKCKCIAMQCFVHGNEMCDVMWCNVITWVAVLTFNAIRSLPLQSTYKRRGRETCKFNLDLVIYIGNKISNLSIATQQEELKKYNSAWKKALFMLKPIRCIFILMCSVCSISTAIIFKSQTIGLSWNEIAQNFFATLTGNAVVHDNTQLNVQSIDTIGWIASANF